jgi:ATP-dependent DNA helicase RecG
MAVMNADRYGLATLHQLRGRVGRGTEKSYCFLHTVGSYATERLSVLRECTDGFSVAEKDFELRGGGNFLGQRQSGEIESLNNYIVPVDVEIVKTARKIADGIEASEEVMRVFRNINYERYYGIVRNSVMA